MYSSFCRNTSSVSMTFGWSLLPQLERSIAFVPRLVVLQAVEQGADPAFSEVIDDPPRRVRLEVADLLPEVSGRGDEVNVVLEYDVTQERQAVLVLQELQESSRI